MFVMSDLPLRAHPNDPGGHVQEHRRNRPRSPVPNLGHLTGLTKNQRRANTDASLSSNQPILLPPCSSLFLRCIVHSIGRLLWQLKISAQTFKLRQKDRRVLHGLPSGVSNGWGHCCFILYKKMCLCVLVSPSSLNGIHPCDRPHLYRVGWL